MFTLLAYDNLTNQSLQSTQFSVLTLFNGDNKPPLLAGIVPTNGSIVATNYVLISGTATDAGQGDNGISFVTVNGVRAQGDTVSGNGIASWNVSLFLSPGPNTVQVIARDGSSYLNATTNALTFTYAIPRTQPPLVIPFQNVANGQFTLQFSGSTGAVYQVWISSNLSTWTLLTNLSMTNWTVQFTDASVSNAVQRFYRVQLPP
jgi:hypothetical protein